MLLVENWTDDVDQTQRLVLPDGSVVTLRVYYQEQQLGWFIRELSQGDFVVRGLRITNNINLLLPWKNLLSFGLACLTDDGREPSLQQDLQTAATKLYFLTSDEVADLEQQFAEAST